MTHICIGKLTIIGSDNGPSPGRRQAIIWTNAGILLIGHFNRNSNIFIDENTFENVVCEMLSILTRPQCVIKDHPGLQDSCTADAFHIFLGALWEYISSSDVWSTQSPHRIESLPEVAYYSWHDDVIKWKHFPRNWPFVRGIHRSRWIPRTKASDAELWCLLWSASE